MALPETVPQLMRLSEAAEQLGVKVSSLRTEIRRGRLRPVEIAGKFYLTRECLGEMVAACRAKAKDHGSTSDSHDQAEAGGSSLTASPNVALDAAKLTLAKLKENSRATSPKSMSRRGV